MANSSAAATATITAEPEPISLDLSRTALVIIDMQRDFIEPGGFGEALGNDVSLLRAAVGPCAAALAAARFGAGFAVFAAFFTFAGFFAVFAIVVPPVIVSGHRHCQRRFHVGRQRADIGRAQGPFVQVGLGSRDQSRLVERLDAEARHRLGGLHHRLVGGR